jgi:hypothetical protein
MMTINLKRNFVLSVFLGLALIACDKSSNSTEGSPDPAAAQTPGKGSVPAVGSQKDIDLQGFAFNEDFEAKGVLATEQRGQIVLLISTDEVPNCGVATLGKLGITLKLPSQPGGPYNETNLKTPVQFLTTQGIENFSTFDVEVLQQTKDEIELAMDLRDSQGGVISGNVKAKICH